jgi:hypothetical protein
MKNELTLRDKLALSMEAVSLPELKKRRNN